ncbi:hypothetical protein BROSI_A3727 [Candidatus Brocadia sinica JPN1]|uniref:Uncharacterized protein n=1 Tax=Candidatus Brocadia sinica JPN1 TaxID=1197129 RepID=A0ABQ0K249_9BACT|nr:hypothetical protein BROSI_A3727 [Candidatus Brocadia sinica JPN1]
MPDADKEKVFDKLFLLYNVSSLEILTIDKQKEQI